jgi:predicted kinase
MKKLTVQYLIIMIGIPGSGKSTLVKLLKAGLPNCVVVCPDKIREDYMTDPANKHDNEFVFNLAKNSIQKYLKERKNVIFDATNTISRFRKDYADIGQTIGAQVVYCGLGTPLTVAKERNSQRENPVPEFVIDRMSAQLRRSPIKLI